MSHQPANPMWYRVAGLRPLLGGHARIQRQNYRGQIWYLLHNRISGRSYRFSASGYQFVGLMDGHRTVEELHAANTEAQGEHAAGGARSYLQDGHMVGGFALVAYPAEYGRSGIMTLIVDSRGLMFQQDLGPETETLAAAIDAYDPGPGWMPVLD